MERKLLLGQRELLPVDVLISQALLYGGEVVAPVSALMPEAVTKGALWVDPNDMMEFGEPNELGVQHYIVRKLYAGMPLETNPAQSVANWLELKLIGQPQAAGIVDNLFLAMIDSHVEEEE